MSTSTPEPMLASRAAEPGPDEIATSRAYLELGLTEAEYDRVVSVLGRRPNWTEASIFGVMWSEHCSYKSSRHLLGKLPTEAPHVLQGPGENAGVVDVGDGWAVAFKVESHNHPSAIEPYHGAATGVGGILRDVFTMGARPIALLNSLRFGPLDGDGDERSAARTRHLFAGVVEGIAGYGNCVGVPTVGGEVGFDTAYTHNPLVNAMCVGVLRHEDLQLGTASGVGNPVLYVGARTGRDGIHGATFASVEDPHERERSAVQVGDPFLEKLLIEACLELLSTGAVVGMQDMGAAGLTSSSVEMAARAGSGLDLDLDLVPRREGGMRGWELMLSESQERMLVVMEEGRAQIAHEIFARWGLECVHIGRVTDSGMIRLQEGGEVVADLPVEPLVDDAPRYERPTREPSEVRELRAFDLSSLPDVDDADAALRLVLARPAIASKEWVYRQYDSMVGAGTMLGPGSDAAVIALRDSDRAIAMSMDCNGRWCASDPWKGGAHAVAEASRNVVCSGARPLGATDCLNFSTPEDPAIAWQLEQAVLGMAAACEALAVPVVSGNVSLYNRTGDVDVLPTPVVGVVGVLDDPAHVTPSAWDADGLELLLIGGASTGSIAGSEYLLAAHGLAVGGAPPLDLALEAKVQRAVTAAIQHGGVRAAHDVSDGGLAVTLAEMAFASSVGARVAIDDPTVRRDVALFGEGGSRIVLACQPERVAELRRYLERAGAPVCYLGATGGTQLTIEHAGRAVIEVDVQDLAAIWHSAIPTIMDEGVPTT